MRKASGRALELVSKAEASGSTFDLAEADRAIGEAKTKMTTKQDVQLTDVLDWYSILLHRRDRERTAVWRQLCAQEVRLYLSGEPEGQIQIGTAPVRVTRGACQAAAFHMMAEDCRQMGRSTPECAAP
jgi:hypothetical protein